MTLLRRALVMLAMTAGCAADRTTVRAGVEPTLAPLRPVPCQSVSAGTALQPILDSLLPGSAVCLEPGAYAGPVTLRTAITLWGPADAVIRSHGVGTTIALEGKQARLVGTTIDGSGARYDQLDAAVRVFADDAVVDSVTVRRATFGILVDRANRVTVRGNHIVGDPTQVLGLRGDGIRLWETRDSVVVGNQIEDSRDLVVWYSPRNEITGNTVVRGRYGTHIMYSHDCVIAGNRYLDDVVGVFVMYAHGVRVERNVMAYAAGAAGIGVGLKDSGDISVVGNLLVDDTIGLYVDNSPGQLGQTNRVVGNRFELCDRGVVFLNASIGNRFEGNAFLDDEIDVSVEGGGDALAVTWVGNHFDAYVGYDLDGNGVGDVAYELRSLQTELVARKPELLFLRGTPALTLADAAGRLLPIFAPTLLLRDERPLVRAPRLEGFDAH